MEYNTSSSTEQNPSYEAPPRSWQVHHEGVFDYNADYPTTDADQLMSSLVTRNTDTSSLIARRFSQTPLAPSRLIDRGVQYDRAVGLALERRVATAADRIGLYEPFVSAVQLEVTMELQRRIKGNAIAASRLYQEIYGTELNENDAELIWKARTGDATLADTGQLLLRYPNMQSIEAAKYTEPFSFNIEGNMDTHIQDGLSGFVRHFSNPSKLSMDIYKSDDKVRRDVHFIDVVKDEYDDTTKSLLSCIMAAKDTIGEVTNGETVIQLVRKHTMMMVPSDLNLKIKYSPPVKQVNGKNVRLLPISISCYWRAAKELSDS